MEFPFLQLLSDKLSQLPRHCRLREKYRHRLNPVLFEQHMRRPQHL